MDTITYYNNPVLINIQTWMMDNEGKVAVGKKTANKDEVLLLAEESANCASPKMMELTKEADTILLVSVSDGDINAID